MPWLNTFGIMGNCHVKMELGCLHHELWLEIVVRGYKSSSGATKIVCRVSGLSVNESLKRASTGCAKNSPAT